MKLLDKLNLLSRQYLCIKYFAFDNDCYLTVCVHEFFFCLCVCAYMYVHVTMCVHKIHTNKFVYDINIISHHY